MNVEHKLGILDHVDPEAQRQAVDIGERQEETVYKESRTKPAPLGIASKVDSLSLTSYSSTCDERPCHGCHADRPARPESQTCI